MKNRDEYFGEIQMAVIGAKCVNDPVCALVVAIYESQSWDKTVKGDLK